MSRTTTLCTNACIIVIIFDIVLPIINESTMLDYSNIRYRNQHTHREFGVLFLDMFAARLLVVAVSCPWRSRSLGVGHRGVPFASVNTCDVTQLNS